MQLPKEVDKFVVESREELKEGTGEEVPTSAFGSGGILTRIKFNTG
jgi:hypothetical protein